LNNLNICNYIRKSEGFYIDGLYLQGCRWSRLRQTIEESNTRLQEFDKLPIIKMKPNIKTMNKLLKKRAFEFKCPVYKTTVRKNNYVFTVSIPSDLNESHWITRGKIFIFYNKILLYF